MRRAWLSPFSQWEKVWMREQCLFYYKRHHHKQQIHHASRQCKETRPAVQVGTNSAQEETDREEKPRQPVAPADDEIAEARRLGYGFAGPDVNKDDRGHERNRCPCEVGEV